MGEFSLTHWLIILVVAIILFGPKRLPEVGKSLGQAISAFKKALKEGMEEGQAQPTTPTRTESAPTSKASDPSA